MVARIISLFVAFIAQQIFYMITQGQVLIEFILKRHP